MKRTARTYSSPDLASFFLGFFLGTFIIGPLIWTRLGRELAIELIRRGAEVTRKQVEEWLKKGEEK